MESTKDHLQGNKINKLFERVNKTNASQEDIAELRKVLKDLPEIASIAGDLADTAQTMLLGQVSCVPLVVESTKVYIEEIKAELGWASATRLERLLIETIINSWIHYHNTVAQLAIATKGSHSMKEGEYLDKKVSQSQKRFIRAIESLAKVRRLLRISDRDEMKDPFAFGNPNGVME